MTHSAKAPSTGAPALKGILDRYADETITDEQVQRVLAPVLAQIRAGRFSRPPLWRCGWMMPQACMVAAVLALVLETAMG